MTSQSSSQETDDQYNLEFQKELVGKILARPGWSIARIARRLEVRVDSVSDWADHRLERRRLSHYRTFTALRALAEEIESGDPSAVADHARRVGRPAYGTEGTPSQQGGHLDVHTRSALFYVAARKIFGEHFETGFEPRSAELTEILTRLSELTGYSQRVLRRWLPPYEKKATPSRALARAFQTAARKWDEAAAAIEPVGDAS